MKKSILLIGLLALMITTSAFAAKEFNLKANMIKLNSQMNNLQRAFISSNKMAIEIALDSLENDVDELFNSKEQMIDMLPRGMKNKKHKANVAFDSSRVMRNGVSTIREAIGDKDSSVRKRQVIAQEAYLSIVNACFKCHNLVRDKGRISE